MHGNRLDNLDGTLKKIMTSPRKLPVFGRVSLEVVYYMHTCSEQSDTSLSRQANFPLARQLLQRRERWIVSTGNGPTVAVTTTYMLTTSTVTHVPRGETKRLLLSLVPPTSGVVLSPEGDTVSLVGPAVVVVVVVVEVVVVCAARK